MGFYFDHKNKNYVFQGNEATIKLFQEMLVKHIESLKLDYRFKEPLIKKSTTITKPYENIAETIRDKIYKK